MPTTQKCRRPYWISPETGAGESVKTRGSVQKINCGRRFAPSRGFRNPHRSSAWHRTAASSYPLYRPAARRPPWGLVNPGRQPSIVRRDAASSCVASEALRADGGTRRLSPCEAPSHASQREAPPPFRRPGLLRRAIRPSTSLQVASLRRASAFNRVFLAFASFCSRRRCAACLRFASARRRSSFSRRAVARCSPALLRACQSSTGDTGTRQRRRSSARRSGSPSWPSISISSRNTSIIRFSPAVRTAMLWLTPMKRFRPAASRNRLRRRIESRCEPQFAKYTNRSK